MFGGPSNLGENICAARTLERDFRTTPHDSSFEDCATPYVLQGMNSFPGQFVIVALI